MYWNTKLAIMPILPTLCVCEKPEWCEYYLHDMLTYFKKIYDIGIVCDYETCTQDIVK